jgi:large subunit ribosomal protein L32e
MVKDFIRRTWKKYSKLGKRRKSKQKWKRPTGRDNKMRDKRRGYPKTVSVGYVRDKELRGTIDGKNFLRVESVAELERVGKNQIAIIGKVGKKRKIEIAKKAKEKKIEIANLNVQRFLKKEERKNKEKKK